jgi:hypothetical protein
MAGQVIHYNVRNARAMFSNSSDREAQGNKVRYSTVRIAGGVGT